MHNLYIPYRDGKLHFYAYRYLGKVVFEELTSEEIIAELTKINKQNIKSVSETGKSLTVTLENGQNIEIDSLEIIKHNSEYTELLLEFMSKIKLHMENKGIEELKSKLPEGHTPRVNRTKSNNLGKRILAAGLAGSVIISLSSLAINFYQKQKRNKGKELPNLSTELFLDNYKVSEKGGFDIPQTVISQPKDDKPILKSNGESNSESKNSSNDEVIELFYEKREDGKLQSTIDYCGDIIEYYSSRYGLPYDVVCSQITQERPNITPEGTLRNPCQLTNFAGNTLTVPVYNENGPTGEYDSYTVTKDMINSLDWNIKIGVGYLRCCVNKYDSLITGIFAYNQGINALSNACKYYELDVNDFKGDENALEARDLVVRYYEELKDNGKIKSTHGDPKYLENVFRYENAEDRGHREVKYFLKNDIKSVEIKSTLEYNNGFGGR